MLARQWKSESGWGSEPVTKLTATVENWSYCWGTLGIRVELCLRVISQKGEGAKLQNLL